MWDLILCFHFSSLPHYIVGLIASGLKLVRVSVRNREGWKREHSTSLNCLHISGLCKLYCLVSSCRYISPFPATTILSTHTHTIWMTLLCCWLSATFQHENHYNYDGQCSNKCHSYNSTNDSCCVVRLSTCRGNTLCLTNIRCFSRKRQQ